MVQEAATCRHEYVTIYQRRLKGLDRRLVATRAYLPVGFKMADFGHLSEGSYCFCSRCRTRLFPKRSQAEKLKARELLAASKAQKELDAMAAYADVEELEIEALGMEDIQAEGVKINDDEESTCLVDDADD
jgi:hypothetical protein